MFNSSLLESRVSCLCLLCCEMSLTSRLLSSTHGFSTTTQRMQNLKGWYLTTCLLHGLSLLHQNLLQLGHFQFITANLGLAGGQLGQQVIDALCCFIGLFRQRGKKTELRFNLGCISFFSNSFSCPWFSIVS